MKNKSPHNSRIFTAHLLARGQTFVFWAFLFSLFAFNITTRSHWRLPYSDKLFDVFTHPLSWETHRNLGQALWQNAAQNQAKQELLLAQELIPQNNDSSVLGVSTTPLDILTSWENEPKEKQQEKQFWLHITETYPDYRDAYIQLASLSYANGNIADSQQYMLKAQALDPNGEVTHKLMGFISKENNDEVTK